jgi:hypothetical protein
MELVWLTEERTLAKLISLGAYFSTVRYTRGGIDYEVQIPNDEIEFYGEDNGDDTED